MSTQFFASIDFWGDFTFSYARNNFVRNQWKARNAECNNSQARKDHRTSSYEIVPDQNSRIRKSQTDYLSSENLTTTSNRDLIK